MSLAFIVAPLSLPRPSVSIRRHVRVRTPLHSRRRRTSMTQAPGPHQREPGTSSTHSLANRLLQGFDPTPELGAILTTYFVQGALSISRLAVSFFLKDNLHLTPAETSALMGAATLPWLIKPVYGFLTDSVPILGSRRRSYLLISASIGVAAWISLATTVNSTFSALLAVVASSLSVAVSDVVVDSLVVQRVRNLPSARSASLQSLCWGASSIGGLLSAYFSGSLLETLGVRPIFFITAVLPLATALLALLIDEPKAEASLVNIVPMVRKRASSLWTALRNPTVFLPASFIFLWQATPSPDAALFYFQTNVLHFGPEFLGRVRLVSSAASLVGIWLYNQYFKAVPLKTFMRYATLVSVPLSLTQIILVTRLNVSLGLSDQLFVLADGAVLTVLGQVAFMPTLVLAARLCPPGVEGTLFAALMSVYNASGATSSELGALLTSWFGVTESNFDNLAPLIFVCSLSYLLPLPFLGLMDRAPPDVEEDASALSPSATTDSSINPEPSEIAEVRD